MTYEPPSGPVVYAILGASVVLAAVWLWISAQRAIARRRAARRWSRAVEAETEAPALLTRLGYTVLGAQEQAAYSLVVDGHTVTVSLRADYIVSRDGRRFVAEVKSGKVAPSLQTATTRRQLLEYLVAFEVDGVLLVDGETRHVHEVVFPLPRTTTKARASWAWWVAFGLTSMVALAWFFSREP